MSETETNECPVCLEPAPQSTWCALRECRHGLCETCAVTLITTQGQSRCPLCRIEILTCPVMVFAEDQPQMKVRWDAAHAGQSDALVATLWRTYETDVDNWSTYLRAMMLQNMGIEPSTDPVVVAHFARLQTAAWLNVARIRDEWMRMHEDEFHVDDINHLPWMNVAAYIALAAARKGTRNWLLHLVAEIPVANILALLAEGPHRARLTPRTRLPCHHALGPFARIVGPGHVRPLGRIGHSSDASEVVENPRSLVMHTDDTRFPATVLVRSAYRARDHD